MVARASVRRGVVTAVLFAALVPGAARAEDDRERSRQLIYAAYDDESAAAGAFKAILAAEAAGTLRLETYAVVSKELDGRVKVKDQRQTRAKAGAIVGALVGVMGGPASPPAGSAAAGAAAYLAGHAVGMSKTFIATIKSSLQPGEWAIVAVVDERHAAAAERLQGEGASRIMAYALTVAAKPAAAAR
jgi:uncharacterized membrane protein